MTRATFPDRHDTAAISTWQPYVLHVALSPRVLVVAQTRIEGAWAAYCDAVPGSSHRDERGSVLERGTKVPESLARLLFPSFDAIRYAD